MSQESCPIYLGGQLLDPGHDPYFKAQICNFQSHKEAIFVKAGESSFSMCWGNNLEEEEAGENQETQHREGKILSSVTLTLNNLLSGNLLVNYLTNCLQPGLYIKAL